MDTRNVRRGERGAAMLMGLFFALFLTAVVFRTYGLAEVILHRQRVQDAADAAAFSAAVVHARGMNLLALINMVMAVVLSVLVALRITETLGYIAIAICGALAWVTGGASLAAIPPLTTVTQQVHNAAEQVKGNLPTLLNGLHAAGEAVKTVVPLAANGRVLDLVTAEYPTTTGNTVGVALPARWDLPVEDGSFSTLCNHAGQVAGDIAMLPLSPIVPGKVRKKIGNAVGTLTEAGSSWFCDGEGDPPDIDEDRKHDVTDLPILPKQALCMEEVEAAQAIEDQSQREAAMEAVQPLCDAASVEYLASVPNRRGQSRAGERFCVTSCRDSGDPSCPPEGFDDCEAEQARDIDRIARATYGDVVVPGGLGSPYATRLELARTQCDPSQGKNLRGFWWREQSVVVHYRWFELDARTRRGEYRRVGEDLERESFIMKGDKDPTLPCPRDTYEAQGTGPVCERNPICLDPTAYVGGQPCPRTRPARGAQRSFSERIRRITHVLRCAELTPHVQQKLPKVDLQKDLASEQDEGQNTNPFRLAKGTWLGGSDLQLRAVVVAGALPSVGNRVGDALWSGAGEAQHAKPPEQLEVLSKVGLAQAEYYFHVGKFSLDDPTDDRTVIEWLWQQGWVARLRPFRLDMSAADGPGADGADAAPNMDIDVANALGAVGKQKAGNAVSGLLDGLEAIP